jgi:glutamate/tyrosine decarboxylase-like PLP-dependent enzyme
VLPHPFGNGHPRFFGWANPPPALEGVLAELIAAAMNPSCAGGDQAAVHLERCAVGWLADLVGFPGHGVLVSGGAAGALTALAAARHRAAVAGGWDDRTEGVGGSRGEALRLYVSDESHSCQHKAARLLGLGDRAVVVVPTDPAGRMRVDALVSAIRADLAAGRRPFCVVATAGVVSTGAIDPLADVAEICQQHGLWFHVDGSLGGFGVLDPDLGPRYRGLAAADSVVLDPHKWLSVPIDCAAVLVRRLDDLRDTFSLVPSYLRARQGDEPWLSEYVFDQTRPFRALKLWATLAGTGTDELRSRIRRNIGQARRLAAQIEAAPELELLARPELSVVAFRLTAGGDELNRLLPDLVQQRGEVFLTGARVRGREAIRACFMHYGTTDADVDRIVPAVLAAAAAAREDPLAPPPPPPSAPPC